MFNKVQVSYDQIAVIMSEVGQSAGLTRNIWGSTVCDFADILSHIILSHCEIGFDVFKERLEV